MIKVGAMSRDERSETVRRSVLKAAGRLLQSKGYEEMTLKDISRSAKVSSGSIYHFFESKDGILAALVQEMFDWSATAADRHGGARDPYLSLAMELCEQVRLISDNPRMADVYRACYRSWRLTEVIVGSAVRRNKSLFATSLPDWGDDQFYAASSAIKGVLAALVDERVHLNRLTRAQRVTTLLNAVLPLFEATSERTAKIVPIALQQLEHVEATHSLPSTSESI